MKNLVKRKLSQDQKVKKWNWVQKTYFFGQINLKIKTNDKSFFYYFD